MASFDLTVLIPTRNRSATLRQTLNRIAEQNTGNLFSFEVIVVDNNSSDDTRKTVQEMSPGYPVPIRYILEETPGKAYAQNTGISAALGRILVFTDDDIHMRPDWLSLFYKTFQEYEADGVGGPVRPLFVGERQAWLSDRLVKQIGVIDHGKETFIVSSNQQVFIGPNSAYRTELFQKHGGFDTARVNNSEDVELFQRLFHLGYKLVYQPALAVENEIECARWTKKKMAARFFSQGRAVAYGIQESGKQVRSVFRIPVWMIRYYIQLHFMAAVSYLRGERDEALWHWLRREIYRGAIVSCFRDWLHKKPLARSRPEVRPAACQVH